MDSGEKHLSIYLHIPFCTSKCTYCAFNTYINLEHLIDAFVDALIQELRIVAHNSPYRYVHTIFFGGGTPSLLSPSQFERILTAISQNFHILNGAEISTEANPNDLTPEYLQQLRSLGMNRLSIGMQSAHNSELKLFARRHDVEAMTGVMQAARNAGFHNINLDLMYGFPYQTLSSWEQTLAHTIALQPEHLSLYALGLEEGTPMLEWVETGQVPSPDDDLAADMYELATSVLSQHGLQQYEISNWSLPRYECQHNLQYWRNHPYIGLGPGAHGYAAGIRYSTILSPQQYIKMLNHADQDYDFPHSPATEDTVLVGHQEDISETLMMNLRLLREGVDRENFRSRFGVDMVELYHTPFTRFEALGLLEITPQTVRITSQGRLLSNAIFRELF